MIDYREILRLDSLGYSRRRISSMVNSSHHTVEDTLKAAHDTGITWPLEDDVTNAELQGILFPWKYVSDSVYAMPDFAYIHRELAKNGVTLTLLWEEYCTKVRGNGSVPYSYTQFGEKYRRWARVTKATMRITHKPGDAMQVDWAGDPLYITDSVTGEQWPAYIFVAVLPCSWYTYAEACGDMKQENWLLCHVHAFDYFGGVPRLLIPDNAKTATITYTVQDGKIIIHFNENDPNYNTLLNSPKLYMDLEFGVRFTHEEQHTEFGTDGKGTIDIVKDTSHDATVDKSITNYNETTGMITYQVDVVSTGVSKGINVQDTISGTLLSNYQNMSVSVLDSKNGYAQVGNLTEGHGYTSTHVDKGFNITIDELGDGHVARIQYEVMVDQASVKKSGNATFDETGNKVTINVPGDDDTTNNEDTEHAYTIGGTKSDDFGELTADNTANTGTVTIKGLPYIVIDAANNTSVGFVVNEGVNTNGTVLVV